MMLSINRLLSAYEVLKELKDNIKYIYVCRDGYGNVFSAHFMSSRNTEVGYSIISTGCESPFTPIDREWGELNIFNADKYCFKSNYEHMVKYYLLEE